MLFRSSADAGKKPIVVNSHEDDVIICAIRMKDGKQLMSDVIKEKEFDACDMQSNIRKATTPKEPSALSLKSKAITEEIAEGTALTAKAVIVGTGNVGRSIKSGVSGFFSSIGDKMKANAELYDQHKAEKACQKAAAKCADQA